MRLSPYSKQHWDGCLCDLCRPIFEQHNPDQNGPICSCGGCQTRNAAIKTRANPFTFDAGKQYNNQGRVKTVATVNFCERCNTMGKSSAMGSIYFRTDPTDDDRNGFEICPGCVADFIAWKQLGQTLEEGSRPKSYSEPYSARKADPLADLSDEQIAAAYLARVAAREGLNELESGSDGTV